MEGESVNNLSARSMVEARTIEQGGALIPVTGLVGESRTGVLEMKGNKQTARHRKPSDQNDWLALHWADMVDPDGRW